MRTIATKEPSNGSAKEKKNGDRVRSRHISPLSTGTPLLQHQCACGGGCPRCQDELGIQTKLKIGEPGDKYEQEADRIADEVMRMPEPSDQRQVEPEEEEMVQRKAINSQFTALIQRQALPNIDEKEDKEGVNQSSTNPIQLASDPAPPPELVLDDEETTAAEPAGLIEDTGQALAEMEVGNLTDKEPEEESVQTSSVEPVSRKINPRNIKFSLGTGHPLDYAIRSPMESFFRQDLAHVRIHSDARADRLARSLRAHALTVGEHIAFATARYQPGTVEGKQLLAHELTHVMQQRHGLSGQILQNGIGAPGDLYEVEAEQNADRFIWGLPSKISAANRQGNQALQLYSGSAAAAYARTWALGTNPSYPRFDNDCTNFVSQSVEAGGWTMVGGSCSDRKGDNVWWYGNSKCWWPGVRASYTWAGAQNFYNFTNVSGRGSAASKVADLKIGDILQMRFDGSTNIGHSMVLTDKKEGNLFFSYHTSDHLDEPFWGSGGILSRYPKATYFAWNL
jgi:Domain of unknown function (DUF4157)/Putative amidase domain